MAVDPNFDFSSIDLTSYLPAFLQDNPFYTDYLTGVTTVWQEGVYPYIKELAEIRQTIDYDTKIPQEIWVLIRNANILGYKFLSNFMDQANYLKLVDFISRFYELQGTYQTANFIGFIKAAKVQIKQLWSQIGINDYTYFEEQDYISNDTIVNYPGRNATGDWYPTSHYRLRYDLAVSGLQDADALRELFYTLAPVHHVLEAIYAIIEFQNEPYYMDIAAAQESIFVSISDRAEKGLTFEGEALTSSTRPLELFVTV